MNAKQADVITRFSRSQSYQEIFARIENAAQQGELGFLFRSLEDWQIGRLIELGYTIEYDNDGIWVFWGWDLSSKAPDGKDYEFNSDNQDCKFSSHFLNGEDSDAIWIEI